MAYLTLAGAILFEVFATAMLRESRGFTRIWPSLGSLLGYGAAFWLLSLTLRTMPVGVAYAIWSGVGVVLISAIGWVFFRQALDAAAMAGIGLILAGVLVLNLFSRTAGH